MLEKFSLVWERKIRKLTSELMTKLLINKYSQAVYNKNIKSFNEIRIATACGLKRIDILSDKQRERKGE